MMQPVFVLIIAQILFSTGDLLARHFIGKYGFSIHTLLQPWFIFYALLKICAIFGQLYVFSFLQLGKTMTLFGAFSIIISNILGILILQEILSPLAYIGVIFAIIAILILVFAR